MFYNNSKNLSALALILAMSISLANISYAQGVVTVVDEDVDELGLSDDIDLTDDLIGAETVVAEQPQPIVDENVALPAEVPATQEAQVLPPEGETFNAPAEVFDQPSEPSPANAEAMLPPENSDIELEDPADFRKNIEKELNDIADLEKSIDQLTANPEGQNASAPGGMPQNMAPQGAMPMGRQMGVPLAPRNAATLGNSVLSQVDNELFQQMSDIEKQTTLLSLELRREKLKSEIAAIKSQRQMALEKAEEEKQARELRKKDFMTEKEIEKIKEMQALEDKKTAYEFLRQEKSLNDYKNRMLESEQRWISENQRLYDKINAMKEEYRQVLAEFESKLDLLKEESEKIVESSQTAKNDFDTMVASLKTQNDQLKKRLEVETSVGSNPFAASKGNGDPDISPQQLNLDYVIMEIRGKGEDLIAKLVNENGESFLVKKGSILKTGHVIKQITHNFIKLERNGIEDYLQFTAGGVVSQEPVKGASEGGAGGPKLAPEEPDRRPSLMMDNSIPSLGNGMFVK